MTQPKNEPKNQHRTRTTNPSLTRPEQPTREGDYQPMQTHLSAEPPVKRNFSTHPCITIRWWAAPARYLPVAVGGAAVDRVAAGAVRCRQATDLAAVGVPARGGGVAC